MQKGTENEAPTPWVRHWNTAKKNRPVWRRPMPNSLTFAGFPRCDRLDALAADIAIIGIPHGTPYRPGETSPSAASPDAVRSASARYATMRDNHDFDLNGPLLAGRPIRVVDCGDVPGDPADPEGNRHRATEAVKTILDADAIPIVLGGDDSIAIPFFRAFDGQGPITLIQVDAHIDWRDEVDGVKDGYSSTMRRASEMAWIDRIIQAGMRGVGSAGKSELRDAAAAGAQIASARELHADGISQVLDRISPAADCLLTLDCDGLDPAVMPGVNAPVPGGLTYWQLIDLIHGIAQKAGLIGVDIVELAPDKDIGRISVLTTVRILFNIIGALARSHRFHP
jgi:agmatinase